MIRRDAMRSAWLSLKHFSESAQARDMPDACCATSSRALRHSRAVSHPLTRLHNCGVFFQWSYLALLHVHTSLLLTFLFATVDVCVTHARPQSLRSVTNKCTNLPSTLYSVLLSLILLINVYSRLTWPGIM